MSMGMHVRIKKRRQSRQEPPQKRKMLKMKINDGARGQKLRRRSVVEKSTDKNK